MAAPQELRVEMLGEFQVRLNGEPLDLDLGNTKRQQLLQLLLYSGDKGITRDRLIECLYDSGDTGDVFNNLKALMFRLRRQMQLVLPGGGNCIRYGGGVYRWNGLPYKLDAHEFEIAAGYALQQTDDAADGGAALLQATELYTGEFLPDLLGCEWVSVTGTRLSKLFGRCVRRVGVLLGKAGDHEKQLAVFSHACDMEPAEEEWQLGRADALTALGRSEEALRYYNAYVKFLFDTLGVAPDEALLARLEKISEQLRQPYANFDEICTRLEDPAVEGAFYCSYPHFQDSYRIISRIVVRTGQSVFLVLTTITNVHGEVLQDGPRLESAMECLRMAIGNTLRTSDIYTRYGNNQFLMLLMGLHQEDCSVVTDRLERQFAQAKESWGFRIQFRAMPVKVGPGSDDAEARFTMPEQWRQDAGPKA